MGGSEESGGGVLETAFEKAKRAGLTLSVHFELTRRCNLKCRHCYVCGADERREMSAAQVFRALDVMADSGTLFITFTGGEPLVRPDFFEIAARAAEKKFAARIFTNGTLIDEAAADRIAALNPLEVGISVYGVKPGTHDYITGSPGSFEKSVAALRALRARDVPVTVKSVIMKPNFSEYGALIDMTLEMGAKYVFDTTVFPRDDGGREPLELRLDDERLAAALGDERLSGRQPGKPMPDVCRGPVCDLSTATAGISPEGDIFPCLQLRKRVGNINEIGSLGEVRAVWMDIISGLTRETENEKRYNCEYKQYCARCPGLAELEDGSATGPSEWACRAARLRAKAKRK
jgi:radical SAM protein with 4Fe4S-binding SPASM domain